MASFRSLANLNQFYFFKNQYIIHLHALLNAVNPSLPEIQAAYDQGWTRLTEKFFQKTEWPEAEIIAPLVNHGKFRFFFPLIK